MSRSKIIDVYKAGGACFASSGLFRGFYRNVITSFQTGINIVVCSAIKEVTRLLVSILEAHEANNILLAKQKLDVFYQVHYQIINELSLTEKTKIISIFELLFLELEDCVFSNHFSHHERYASVLHYGELASSRILSSYLHSLGINNIWFDARCFIKTKGRGKKVSIYPSSESLIESGIPQLLGSSDLLITQGFIGRDYQSDENTVLPFDGSDTSAAYFAHSLWARKMVFLKDVCGVCVADNPAPNDINHIHCRMSYHSYLERFKSKDKYPVHPEAIEILSHRKIRTRICSFMYPDQYGTEITI